MSNQRNNRFFYDMAFDAEQRKMNDILSGDFKYIIPRYQRKYVWQEKQWRELFDDIKYCHLIVIDGQQRLTALSIMLCAICTMYSEFKDEAHFRGVKKYIIWTDDILPTAGMMRKYLPS
ncbi:MAG: DUF262 domain-containing protein [Lachnospiraceae bacterium]|nr:DUF262 domain-containing protein [Lachnospiraceae bacterium]